MLRYHGLVVIIFQVCWMVMLYLFQSVLWFFMESKIWMLIDMLRSYYAYTTILFFLLCFCKESSFVNIPQVSKIVDFLESDYKEEVKGLKYLKIWWWCYVVLYSFFSFLCLYYACVMLKFCLFYADDIIMSYFLHKYE